MYVYEVSHKLPANIGIDQFDLFSIDLLQHKRLT